MSMYLSSLAGNSSFRFTPEAIRILLSRGIGQIQSTDVFVVISTSSSSFKIRSGSTDTPIHLGLPQDYGVEEIVPKS
jgi:hypothetical protein